MDKRLLKTFILILIIFLTGFLLRMESARVNINNSLYVDSNGVMYFQESDSYYNYRLTSNLLYYGHIGDKIINGKPWDLHSYYPPGVPVDYPPLLQYITIIFYSTLNLITPMSLKEACLWIPVILGPLAGVVGFLFSRRITGNFGGFLTGMLIVISPLYIFRTNFGFFDNDTLGITLALFVIWLLFEAENAKTRRDKMILSGYSGFLLFLFSLAWNGWLYFFYIIIATFIYILIKRRDWRLILPFLLVSIISLGIFNTSALYKAIIGPYTYINYFLNQNIWYPWPDSYKNVSELQVPSIGESVSSISPLISILGFMGLLIIAYPKCTNLTPLTRSIMILWTVTSILSILKGGRFLLLLIPILSILAGIFWYSFKENLKNVLKSAHKNMIIIILQSILVSVIILQSLILLNAAFLFTPIYDDYFMEAAQWIDNNTPENTVIITDWGYGHFFASEARPVAFDGRLAYIETLPIRGYWYDSSLDPEVPTTARDHWINLALTTDNPTLSENICRMLATSGDNAYLLINNYTHNKTLSYKILHRILSTDKKFAHDILKENGLSDEETERVLNYTHPKASRPFIIIIITKGIFSNKTYPPRNKIIYQVVNSTSLMEWNGRKPYSIIGNGAEKIIDKKGNFSIIIRGNRALIVNKNYRNSLIIKFLISENVGNFMEAFENEKIKIYTIKK